MCVATYVEFFNEEFVNEAGYISPDHLDPIQDAFKPKKPSRKFEKALEAAKQEQMRVDAIVHVSILCTFDKLQVLKSTLRFI